MVVTKDDFSQYILGLGEKYQIRINAQYLVATSIGRTNGTNEIIAWFNNQPFHTAPLALNLVHNAIVRAMVGNDHSIRVINKPLPFTMESRINFLEAGNNIGFQLASNLGFAMAFVAAFYVMFYIKVCVCSIFFRFLHSKIGQCLAVRRPRSCVLYTTVCCAFHVLSTCAIFDMQYTMCNVCNSMAVEWHIIFPEMVFITSANFVFCFFLLLFIHVYCVTQFPFSS